MGVQAFQSLKLDSDLSETFLEDSSIKLTALEGLLKLTTCDYRFDEYIRELLMIVLAAIKSESGSILELNPKKKTLFFRAALGPGADKISSVEIPIGHGIVGQVAQTGLPILVSNAPENKDHLKSVAGLSSVHPKNLIAAPIFVRGKLYGVVELLNKVGETDFNHSDLDQLKYLAKMASKVIEVRMMINWVKAK